MTWWAWMILGAVLLGAELFAVDAQFYLVFLGVSAAIVTFRVALYTKLRGGGQGFGNKIAGDSVSVTNEIASGGHGRAQYRGSDWNIHNVGEQAIAAGSRARVVEVDGLTLKVEAE